MLPDPWKALAMSAVGRHVVQQEQIWRAKQLVLCTRLPHPATSQGFYHEVTPCCYPGLNSRYHLKSIRCTPEAPYLLSADTSSVCALWDCQAVSFVGRSGDLLWNCSRTEQKYCCRWIHWIVKNHDL